MPRRPILLALLVAALTTAGFLLLVRARPESPGTGPTPSAELRATVGSPAPPLVGSSLDGAAFDLTSLAGKPVVINFWGPSCVPCREEFPLLESKVTAHAADGLTVVGVLTDDPVDAARAFVARYGATWSTVVDPDKTIRTTYRVAARPQSYFVDRTGVLRSIQVGELTDADFERQYRAIAQ
jgi:cytochrome c biogenesis protein CcmG, thiol:disulfide interchange protein DsbE